MARSFNSLKASDVIVTPIRLKYSQSYDSASASSGGIQFLTGSNGTTSPTGSYPQDFLLYRSVRNSFYMNYLSGSLLQSASYFDWSPQSTAASGTLDDDNRYFPTESTAKITVISIPRSQFGEQISRNSFIISSSNFNIIDDGNGNIINISGSKTHVGNIIYPQGFAIITNKAYINLYTASYSMSFQAETTLYQNKVICHINENDFNYSNNPSMIVSGSTPGLMNNNVTGSDFNPYATTVGLYNDANELLVVGKLAAPFPVPRNTDVSFIIQWDS
jgi:hypothetical protein